MVIDPPNPKCKKFLLRWTQDGRRVSFIGENSHRATLRLASKISAMIEAKACGDYPPQDLIDWSRKLSPKRLKKLQSLGLVDGVVSERTDASISVMASQFKAAVASRRNNTATHAKAQARKVEKIAEDLNLVDYRDLVPEKVLEYLRDKYDSPTTRRHYLVAIRDFCDWAVKSGRSSHNPFAKIELPVVVPDWDRHPFTVGEVKVLFNFLKDHDRYPEQRTSKWNGYDRMLIYWTAIKTGYRLNELRSLCKRHLFKSGDTWLVGLEGKKTKNRKNAAVPIPDDLAESLQEYLGDIEPSDPMFWIPIGHGPANFLRRDIQEAGLGKILKGGQQVDFHCLRATSITWWLHEDKRSPKEVQMLARFGSLAMVDKYTRGFSNDVVSWAKQSTPVF